jgi:hypothetical protein
VVTNTHTHKLLYSIKGITPQTSKPKHTTDTKLKLLKSSLVKMPVKSPAKTPAAKKPITSLKIGTMHTTSHFAPLPSNEVM